MSATYHDLKDRTVVITGGASGIGAAIVEAFARQNARVGFIDVQHEAGSELARRLQGDGFAVEFIQADLTDIGALRGAIHALRQSLGPIRVLVNNAALDDRHSLEGLTPERFDALIGVNLKQVVFAAQAILPDMIAAHHGSIINFSSISWMAGSGGMPVYTAAKSAMLGLTRSLARDYGKHGVRVNTITPGWIRTERQERLWITPVSDETVMTAQCLKRWLKPAEVARMALFLASDEASACTSQSFIVDGGWV